MLFNLGTAILIAEFMVTGALSMAVTSHSPSSGSYVDLSREMSEGGTVTRYGLKSNPWTSQRLVAQAPAAIAGTCPGEPLYPNHPEPTLMCDIQFYPAAPSGSCDRLINWLRSKGPEERSLPGEHQVCWNSPSDKSDTCCMRFRYPVQYNSLVNVAQELKSSCEEDGTVSAEALNFKFDGYCNDLQLFDGTMVFPKKPSAP